jgi:hypothetical protein
MLRNVFDKVQGSLKAITMIVRQLALGTLPMNLRQALIDTRGIMLDKGNGKIRPIAISEVLYRIAAGILTSKLATPLSQCLTAWQFGAPGRRAGTECMAAYVQTYLDMNRNHVLISVDCKNAFNAISREAILRGIQLFEDQLGALLPLVKYAYQDSSRVVLPTTRNLDTIIISEEGARQGDPLGPALFCLGFHYLTKSLQSEFPNCTFPKYMDDLGILGPPEEAANAFTRIKQLLSVGRLEVNDSKCVIYSKSKVDQIDELRDLGLKFEEHGTVVLGVPIGSDDYCTSYCDSLVDPLIEKTIQAISSTMRQCANTEAQMLFQLVRVCIPAKLNHLIRAVPRRICEPAIRRFDEAVMDLILSILEIPQPTAADKATLIDQIHLSSFRGGLGIRSLAKSADAAYIGSWALTLQTVATLCPMSVVGLQKQPTLEPGSQHATNQTLQFHLPGTLPVPSIVPQPILDLDAAFVNLRREQLISDEYIKENANYGEFINAPVPRIQHKLTLYQGERTQADLLQRVQGDQKACLLATSGKHSGAWVMCIPRRKDTRMDRDIFHFAVRMRLGLALHPATQPGSRQLVCPISRLESSAITDKHLLSCKLSPKAIRHTHVQQMLRKIAKECGAEPSEALGEIQPKSHWPEKLLNTPTSSPPQTINNEIEELMEDGGRHAYQFPAEVKGDIAFNKLRIGYQRAPLITDVTIVKEDTRNLTVSTNTVGEAARRAEIRKLKWYNDRFDFPSSLMPVVPFVIETLGTFGTHACQLLTKLVSIHHALPRPTATTPASIQDESVLFANKDMLTPKGRRIRYHYIERLSVAVQIANYRMYTRVLERHRPVIGRNDRTVGATHPPHSINLNAV